MQARKPSFMLLPDFSFVPNHDLKLGTLLASDKSGRPDPRRPLNTKSHIPVDDASIARQRFTSWSYADSQDRNARLGLSAGLSIIPLAGGGLGGSKDKFSGLKIFSDQVDVEWFSPDHIYFEQSLAKDSYRSYAGGFGRPSLYMITGIMVAKGGSIDVKEKSARGLDANLVADGTVAGIPGQLGPEISWENSASIRSSLKIDRPFILAYQLRRIQLKKDGSRKDYDENRWALFNDDRSDDVTQADLVPDLHNDWHIEAVREMRA